MGRKYKRGHKFRDKWEFERFAMDFEELLNSFEVKKMKLKEYRKLHSLEESVAHAKEQLDQIVEGGLSSQEEASLSETEKHNGLVGPPSQSTPS